MDTPENTLLAVLQIVTLILTLLLLVGARQAGGRPGAWLWVLGFAIHPLSQFLRQFATSIWGHAAGLPFGHAGGAVAYALVYVGTRQWFGLLPRNGLAFSFCLLAVMLSGMAASQDMGFVSLALTTCVTALFEGLCAVTFWEAFRRDGGLVRSMAAAVFSASAVASLLRAEAIAPAWHEASDLLPANTKWLLAFIAFGVLQAGSLLNLINQSLLDQLRSLADFDALTGLLNRGGLARRMRHRRAHYAGEQAGMAVLCLDLDHFKHVNDTYGHGAGDDVLRGVGLLLQENARPNDLPSRSGGEEFGLVVDTDSEQALLVFAERLRGAVASAPFDTRAGPIPTTVSIGAAFAPGGDEATESVWDRADLALLEAKRAGRNRVAFGARSQVASARASDSSPG